jgi:hypothetical protein
MAKLTMSTLAAMMDGKAVPANTVCTPFEASSRRTDTMLRKYS